MYPINTVAPIATQINQTNKQQVKTEKAEKVELTRSEIISSKDLTPEQKLEKLGIKPMTVNEMASGLTDKIMDGEV